MSNHRDEAMGSTPRPSPFSKKYINSQLDIGYQTYTISIEPLLRDISSSIRATSLHTSNFHVGKKLFNRQHNLIAHFASMSINARVMINFMCNPDCINTSMT